MIIYKNNNKNIIFIHIPKNGGTYLSKLLPKEVVENSNYQWGWDKKIKLDIAHIPYFYFHKNKNVLSDKRDIIESKDTLYYCFTRNPYDRIISVYKYKNHHYKYKDINNFVKNYIKTGLKNVIDKFDSDKKNNFFMDNVHDYHNIIL